MKKLTALTLALLLMLTACGTKTPADTAAPDTPPASNETAESTLRFALGEPLTFAEEYSADDGTPLLTVTATLPQLEFLTADGAVYALPTTSNTADVQPKEVTVRDAFNAEMARRFDEAKSYADDLLDAARDHYASLDEEYREYWSPYFSELEAEVSYMTDGIVSVTASTGVYCGGAHPNSGTYGWNFDLTTGEFLTLDSLDAQPSAMTALGETLTHTLAVNILELIDREGLQEEYYDDYYSYIFDLAANANYCFTPDGMTVTFDPYVIAPYAAGSQSFDLPYGAFYSALDAHTQSLLDVSRDELVLASYPCAKTLWAWFYMTTAPIDTGTAAVSVDDLAYYRVACGDLTSLDALRELLCTYLAEDLADEWLGTGRFLEVNGALYTFEADRGSSIDYAAEDLAVEWDSDTTGTLVQTMYLQAYDETTGALCLTGETEEYRYPFTMQGDRAVFSDFPCPW